MGDSPSSWEAMYCDEKYSWFWPPAYDSKSDPPEIEAVVSLLGARPGTRLLDLACGRGWLTIHLAQRGFDVTGFDLSAVLLTRAEQAANQARVRIEWVRGDMRDLPSEWTDCFEYVTFTLSEFGCFSNESENQQVLHEVARVLKAGGRFLLDIVVNRDELILHGETYNCLEGDGFFVSEQGSLDLLTGIHQRVFHWYYQGQRHETKWQIRAYTPPEVAGMLEKAGFQVLAVYGNLVGDMLTRDSTGMTFIAQKQAISS
ncbi:MAG: methyltransferase domain-containing protein [Chloroflexi bacterium]|nr:methyltransferase domain-containing protein [Chloroflexota bacterium]